MLGVYIHFPFCERLCPYCDFAVEVRKEIDHEGYADAILRELAAKSAEFSGRELVSIYFGGGTPSLWRPDCIARVILAVRAQFPSDRALEITLEANPDDGARFAEFRAAGINRLSIGAQSFQPAQLVFLGRSHSAQQTLNAVAAARAAGFDNFSLDLIIGQPGQQLDADLDTLIALDAQHVSAYSLTIEQRTPFYRLVESKRLVPLDDDAHAAAYDRTRARLKAAGYHHYEISSYARSGRAAVHNTLYWQSGEYLGLGCSAHSLRFTAAGAERFANVRALAAYLAAEPNARVDSTLVPLAEAARDATWLGLRHLDGLDRAAHRARFHVDIVALLETTFAKLRDDGFVTWDDTHIRLTEKGVLFADTVAAAIVNAP